MKIKELQEALENTNPEMEIVIDCYFSDRTFIAEIQGIDKTEDHLVIVTELIKENKNE